jgi:predicted dinucleotide-binding enzyme
MKLPEPALYVSYDGGWMGEASDNAENITEHLTSVYTEAQMREMYQQGVTDAANRAQIAMLGIPYHWTKRVVAAIYALKEKT